MVMLGFIVLGHPDWKNSNIRIFEVTTEDKMEATRKRMDELLNTGRLSITKKNVEIIVQDKSQSLKELITERSHEAGLTILGFSGLKSKDVAEEQFKGFEGLKTVIFVNSEGATSID
jgi:hypothetical protein